MDCDSQSSKNIVSTLFCLIYSDLIRESALKNCTFQLYSSKHESDGLSVKKTEAIFENAVQKTLKTGISYMKQTFFIKSILYICVYIYIIYIYLKPYIKHNISTT